MSRGKDYKGKYEPNFWFILIFNPKFLNLRLIRKMRKIMSGIKYIKTLDIK